MARTNQRCSIWRVEQVAFDLSGALHGGYVTGSTVKYCLGVVKAEGWRFFTIEVRSSESSQLVLYDNVCYSNNPDSLCRKSKRKNFTQSIKLLI